MLQLQLTSLLSETGLDIQEAHAFSTLDGYSLDVFVVGGWEVEVFFPCFLNCSTVVQSVETDTEEN